jgi:D-serine dehydratase
LHLSTETTLHSPNKPDPLISPFDKGLGPLDHPTAPDEIAALGWNLLHEDLSLPVAVLYQDKLNHNLRWMRQFIDAYGMKLAPHGKTTMAPRLFEMQLAAGAWGITLATAHQTRVAYHHGVRRVLMANQLIGRQNMAIITALLDDPAFDYYCLVDSADQIDQLASYLRSAGKRLQVLLELGPDGGRTGIRNAGQLESVLAALDRSRDTLSLAGVELFEGVLDDEGQIRSLLKRAATITRDLLQQRRFDRQPAILTGAGSAWYDVVADVFSAAAFGDQAEIILRPGCYLTHDAGSYRRAQERILACNPIAQRMRSGLIPALHVWAYVQSIPEKDKAIVTLGKRDAAFDSGLPMPAVHYRPGTAAPLATPSHWTLTRMMDQHAFLQISAGDDIRTGDMIAFDISHPCLTFDKWRCLPILDADYRVIDIVQTYF